MREFLGVVLLMIIYREHAEKCARLSRGKFRVAVLRIEWGLNPSGKGEPQICDFGIERIMEDINENTTSKTVSSGDAVRYSAIELIENYDASTTKNSDTYSFALLILECITEEVPFSNYAREAAVIHARISKRQCPSRPDGQYQSHIPDDLWGLMSRCWAAKPDNRPSMEQVHSFFLNQAQQR